MAENASISIPKDLLEPAIQAHVAKALTEAMGCRGELLEALANRILTQPVDADGRPSNYEKRTWIQWMLDKTAKEAIREAIISETNGLKEKLKVAIDKEIKKPNSKFVTALAEASCDALIHAAEYGHKFDVSFTLKK